MAAPMTIPKTQTAAIIETFGKDLTVRTDWPVKQPYELAPGECLVKLEYSGVCHSDLHVRNGDWATKAAIPLVGGHEGVGTVIAIGEHTADSPVNVGDRVGIKWIGAVCLRCDMCRKGHESSCVMSFQKASGYMIDGTFAQYVTSYVDYVTPIPSGLDSAAAAPILCAGLTIYKALKQTNTLVGDWVAISGAGGGLGHLGVQYAVAMGLRVIAIDTGEEKRKLTQQLGAEKWIDFRESENLIQDVIKAADGQGPHAAVIAAGTEAPFNQALMYLRATGTLVAVGLPGNAFLNIPISLLIAKSLHVVGSAIGNRQDAVEALELAARGKVTCHFETKTLEDVNSVLNYMESGKVVGRVVLKI